MISLRVPDKIPSMQENKSNCIGYVSLKMGFDRIERFIPPPRLAEVMAVHDEVPDLSSAEVVGVVRSGGNDYHDGPTVCHLAVVMPGGLISHRKEFDADITYNEPFTEGLEKYLVRPEDFRIIYLVRKTDA